jgi:hypothetical protein
MNQKQRRELTRKVQAEDISLQVIHPDAAGIDIGNEAHYVAVPANRDSQAVRRFGCTTAELRAMAVWLKQCRIQTVAMQSTGVYWIAVYDLLEESWFGGTWSMPERRRICQDGRATYKKVNGYEAAHLWTAAKLISTFTRDPNDEDVLAAAQ